MVKYPSAVKSTNIVKRGLGFNTYYIVTNAVPLGDNPLATKIGETKVYFWIVDSGPEIAMDRAAKYLDSYKWKLRSIETEPVEVSAANFAESEVGLKNWWKAKQKGFAAHFVGKPRTGPT